MAITRIQYKRGQTTGASTINVTLDSAPINGNILVAEISTGNYDSFITVSTISQSNVNWLKIAGPAQHNDGESDIVSCEIWIGIVSAGASASLTVNLSGGPEEGGVCNVCEYSGVLTVGYLDKIYIANGGFTLIDTGPTDTTTQAEELWVGGGVFYEDNPKNPINGFTYLDGGPVSGLSYWIGGIYWEKIVNSTGVAEAGDSISSPRSWGACIVTLKGIIPKTQTYSIDVIQEKLGITKTNLINIVLKKLGVTKTDSINVLLKKFELTKTALLDVLFLGGKTDNIDTLFELLDIPTNYSIDTLILHIKYYGIDVILKPHSQEFAYIDVLFQNEFSILKSENIDVGFAKILYNTDSIDVVLKKENSPIELTDVLFKAEGVTTTNGIDCILVQDETQRPLHINNPNGDLWCFPLKWSEHQLCVPAIRPIPLAESEYLDDGTYVLETRRIDVTFRLSDREKDVFESIYAYASTTGSSFLTNFYLNYNFIDSHHPDSHTQPPQYTWYYIGWITDKDYSYEYSMQDGRYVRWWIVNAKIDVQSFSGSTANEPTYSHPFSNAIKINNHKLVQVLDFNRSDSHPPMIPNWVNQPAEVDSYIWNECVLDIEYINRMSNDEKYLMDLTLLGHTKVSMNDYIHNVIGQVWVREIEATFDPENWAKPWKYRVYVQGNNSEITFDSQASISVDSWGVDANGAHIGPDSEGTLYIDEETTPLVLPSGSGGPSGEQIINGGFEDGDLTGWTDFDGQVYTDVPHTGLYDSFLYENWIKQTFPTPIPKSDIASFTFWALNYNSFPSHNHSYRIGYSDATSSLITFNTSGDNSNWTQFDILSNITNGKSVSYIQFLGDTGHPYLLDDVSCITVGVPLYVNYGVHVFYFFLPSPSEASGFYQWNITGNACIVSEEGTNDVHTFDRESRVSILIYGDCTITPKYIVT